VNEGVKAFLPGFEEAVMFVRLRFDACPYIPRLETANKCVLGRMTHVSVWRRLAQATTGGLPARSAPSELGE
jgi:hypothetical protein